MVGSPLPGVGVTHHQGDLTSHLRGRYSSFVALTGSCARPPPSPRLGGPLVGGVCAGCRESLLDHGPSRHYLCNLCGGAWTHTPPCPSGAHAHFFPGGSGLTSRETRSAHGRIPARRFRQGAGFRGCSHSLMFRLPHSLDPQIVPTAVRRLGGQAVYTTHRPAVTPSGCGIATCLHGQLSRLDLHQLDDSLVGCSFPHGAFLSASCQGL